MDDNLPKLDTSQKALRINLNPARYGSFAEIGAGQEVARWFFKIGGAATLMKPSCAFFPGSAATIKDNAPVRENMVPPEIAEMIKLRHFFGSRNVEGVDLIAKSTKESG